MNIQERIKEAVSECVTGKLGGRTLTLLKHLHINPHRIRDGFVGEKDIEQIKTFLLSKIK